jgi:hypothetical protein
MSFTKKIRQHVDAIGCTGLAVLGVFAALVAGAVFDGIPDTKTRLPIALAILLFAAVCDCFLDSLTAGQRQAPCPRPQSQVDMLAEVAHVYYNGFQQR